MGRGGEEEKAGPVGQCRQHNRAEGREVGNSEGVDERVARQPSQREEERPRKERRCGQGTVGILEGPSAIWGTERPRRGRHSAEGMRIKTRHKRKNIFKKCTNKATRVWKLLLKI